jgi:hypothetical protein
MERWIAEAKDGSWRRWEGAIGSLPEFKGWVAGNHSHAFVLVDGRLCEAHKQRARMSESRLCHHTCKKAHPLTSCLCICAGQNHGIDYDGTIPEVELTEDDEVWLGMVPEASNG